MVSGRRNMRLLETKHLMNEAMSVLHNVQSRKAQAPGGLRIAGAASIVEALTTLSKIPIFSDANELASGIMGYIGVGDGLYMTVEQERDFMVNLAALRMRVKTATETINLVAPVETPLSMSFKIPPTKSLEELAERLAELRAAVEYPTLRITGHAISFTGFDVGSEWLVLAAVVLLPVRFVFGLLSAAMSYRAKAAIIEREEKVNEALGIRGEALGNIKNAQKVILDAYARSLAAGLVEEHSGDSSAIHDARHENESIALKAIKDLDGLISRGAELRPALIAPKQIQEIARATPAAALVAAVETKLLSQQNPNVPKDQEGM